MDGAVVTAEGGHPAPVDGLAERLADAGLVERRLGRVEAVVLDRQRGDLPELWPERLVIAEPGRVDARHRRVVDVARREGVHRGLPAQTGDQVDGGHRRRARPVVGVGRQLELGVGLAGQDVPAARHEAGSGRQGRPARIDPRRHDGECRTRHHVDEVGRGMDQIDGEGAARIVGVEPDRRGVGRSAVEVGVGALDAEDQRGQRRGMRRVDQPQPAAGDVRGTQRAPVGEGQVRSHVERHLLPAIPELPRFGQRGTDLEIGVEAGQRLEQLGGDGGAARVALGRGVERRRRSGQDPDRLVGARAGRPRAGDEQRRKREEGEESAHRAEYRSGRLRGPGTASGRLPGTR